LKSDTLPLGCMEEHNYLALLASSNMTYYHSEINKIKATCYSNQAQLATVIGTRHYINQNFDKALKLDFLSHVKFTSKFHLLRLFKKYYGLTPKQYHIDKRLEMSKEILKRGVGVTETCYAVGFECPSSFSTLFKRKHGVAPVEFQKKQLSQSRLNDDRRSLSR